VKSCKRSRRPSPRKRATNDRGSTSGVDGTSVSHLVDCNNFRLSNAANHNDEAGTIAADDEGCWCELNVSELAWVVGAHEVAEGFMARSRPAEAYTILTQLLDLSPSDVLAHVKLAVALLAADAEDGAGTNVKSISGATEARAAATRAARTHAASAAAARQLQVPMLLRRAVQLERENAHPRTLVDLCF